MEMASMHIPTKVDAQTRVTAVPAKAETLTGSARTIREAVADFQKGNMRLGLALTLVKEEMK